MDIKYFNLVEVENVEVLQSIVGYTDYLKVNNMNVETQKKCIRATI